MSDKIDQEMLQQKIIDAIKMVFDPEIPVNIYDLGLIYEVVVDENANVHINMTLTSPGCPVAQSMPLEVKDAAHTVEGIKDVTVDMVWDPPWTMDNMSDEAKLQLGLL